MQSIFPLSDGSIIKLTIAKDYLKSGKAIQDGILPNININEEKKCDLPLLVAQTALRTASANKTKEVNDYFEKITRGLLSDILTN